MPKQSQFPMLINRAEVRKVILRIAARDRPGHEFTRVSARMLNSLDSRIRLLLKRAITHHPSVGKTLDWDFTEVL